jgi:hypothetical protein
MSGWYFFGYLTLGLQAATWLLLVGFGIWLYRRLRLRSLPWLVAYVALALPLSQVMPWLLDAMVTRGAPGTWTMGELLIVLSYATMFVESLSGLLLVVIAAGEIDVLLGRFFPGPPRRSLLLLFAAREGVVPLGVALLALRLAEPLAVTILWLA